jgi:hypothetical protein
MPPKEHFLLDSINLNSLDHRGKAWYAKLLIERETANQLFAQLVHGEEDRGDCTFLCKSKKSDISFEFQDWRLNCCVGDHDKSARKAAASAAQPQLVKAAAGAAPDATGVAAVRNLHGHDGEKLEDATAVKKERRKKLAAGQSIKVGCNFELTTASIIILWCCSGSATSIHHYLCHLQCSVPVGSPCSTGTDRRPNEAVGAPSCRSNF